MLLTPDPDKRLSASDLFRLREEAERKKKRGKKTRPLDKDVASFLARLNLTELSEIFAREELSLDDVLKLTNEELKDIGVDKLKTRKFIIEEAQKMKKMVITSTGGVSQNAGGVLGQYEFLEDKKYYVQTSTEQSHEKFKALYMYPDSDNCWWVWTTPGEKKGALRNPRTNSEGLPENGHWQYADLSKKSYQDDRTLTVS